MPVCSQTSSTPFLYQFTKFLRKFAVVFVNRRKLAVFKFTSTYRQKFPPIFSTGLLACVYNVCGQDCSKLFLYDVLVVTACGTPGGSRQDVYNRFLRHFKLYAINPFSEDSMTRIFTNVLQVTYRRLAVECP